MKNRLLLLIIGIVICSKIHAQQVDPRTIWPELQPDIAYYLFNGNANDESGNGHHALVNGATPTADRLGNPNSAYLFNEGSITLPFSGLKFPQLITWWVKVSDENQDTVFESTNFDNFKMLLRVVDHRYQLELTINGLKHIFADTSGSNIIFPDYPRFDFMALRSGGNSFTFYINGNVFPYVFDDSLVNNNDSLSMIQNPQFKVSGIIDDIGVYKQGMPIFLIGLISADTIVKPPILTSDTVSLISQNSATIQSKVSSTGGTELIETGIYYSTSSTPETTNNQIKGCCGDHDININLTGLIPNTTYYVKAYAVNYMGYGYGKELTFTTLPDTINGSITDIEGNVYKTVKIGSQTWMAENLKVTSFNDSTKIPLIKNGIVDFVYFAAFRWYDNDSITNKNKYGALYNGHAVNTHKLCPIGSHIPSNDEWAKLTDYLGGVIVAGDKLKEAGSAHWEIPNKGASNESGFTALPGGSAFNDFYGINSVGVWWSTEQNWSSLNWARRLTSDSSSFRPTDDKIYMFNSVRCIIDTANQVIAPVLTSTMGNFSRNDANIRVTSIRNGGSPILTKGVCWSLWHNPLFLNSSHTTEGEGSSSFTSLITELKPNTTYYVRAYAINSVGTGYGNELSFTTLPEITEGSITDVEGNVYKTVQIGTQTWMAENLKTTKYNDGTPVPLITDNALWASLSTPAYCWYNNDQTTYGEIYGALYNWYTVNAGNLCPTDWHVPSINEWSTLITYLGGNGVAGGKLKEADTVHWNNSNVGATNSSGFSALPSGAHYGRTKEEVGYFCCIRDIGFWWTATESDTIQSWDLALFSDMESIGTGWSKKQFGFSVRCVGPSILVPELTTDNVTDIMQTTAMCGSSISSDNGLMITGRGVCWSISPNPDTTDNKTYDGNGTGNFTSNITGLTPNKTYYIRAYAINSDGIGYGNEISFITLDDDGTVNLERGLVAYYPFNGNANDESGFEHNGVVNGSTMTKDRFGIPNRAYSFNGQDNSITVDGFNLPSSAASIACWVMTTNGSEIEEFVSKHEGFADVELLIRVYNFRYRIEWNIGGTYFTLSDNSGQFLIDPQHPRFDLLTLTYDGHHAKFYVNQTLMESREIIGQIARSNFPLTFGRYAASPSDYLNGVIDDIRIYNRALNTAEITALYYESDNSISRLTNIALNKPVTQSSTQYGGVPERAVDGYTNGYWNNGSVTHTYNDVNAWWEVDLGGIYNISTIELWNRADNCCKVSLSDFYVFASDRPFESKLLDATLNQSNVWRILTSDYPDPADTFIVGRTARFIRIQSAHTTEMNIAEVRVMGSLNKPKPVLTNVALNKPVSQSSTKYGGVPERAVDGNTNGDWSNNSVTHTYNDTNAWWEVDLGGVYNISSIELWNRTNSCCKPRLSDFYVFASDEPFSSRQLEAALNQPNVWQVFTSDYPNPADTFMVGRTARYIRIQSAYSAELNIAEVIVMGSLNASQQGPTNVAHNKPVTQSSTQYGGVPERAVDGNTNGDWNNYSVTHTYNDINAWWEVDLGGIYNINTIELWNRTNSCCRERLSDFYVFASEEPFVSKQLYATINQPNVWDAFTSDYPNPSDIFTVNRTARYVRIQSAHSVELNIAEVVVMGTPTETTFKSSDKKTASDASLKPDIIIYPVPFSNVIYFESTEIIISIEFLNVLGESLIMQKCGKLSAEINTDFLMPGLYYARIMTANGKMNTYTIIKSDR